MPPRQPSSPSMALASFSGWRRREYFDHVTFPRTSVWCPPFRVSARVERRRHPEGWTPSHKIATKTPEGWPVHHTRAATTPAKPRRGDLSCFPSSGPRWFPPQDSLFPPFPPVRFRSITAASFPPRAAPLVLPGRTGPAPPPHCSGGPPLDP